MRSIQVSLGTISVQIPQCRLTEYEPFLPVKFASVEHTAQGAAAIRGYRHEPRLMWSLTALLEEPDMNLIRGMYWRSEKRRRSFQNPGIFLTDLIQRFVEGSPRTRAIAPGTSEITVNGLVQYYGLFEVYIVDFKTPKFGAYYSVSLDMVEIEKIVS